jgi:large subunit GTPase 1
VVGLVGYPNVGKSSTINALLGEKKVSVSSTPGKTKHFQTIHLSNSIILCDCPGLVFPQFATTKADLVCDGVLPIDQMKEYTGPIALVVRRIPKEVLEALYGLSVKVNTLEEGGEGSITAENLLISYASTYDGFFYLHVLHTDSSSVARGFTRSGQGNPDEARAARYILKDYVNAKLLFCHPPPGSSETNFNHRTHELALQRAHGKKHAPVTRVKKDADTFVGAPDTGAGVSGQLGVGPKSRAVDRDFFANGSTLSARPFIQGSGHDGHEFTRAKLYPHQNSVADDGTPLSLREARVGAVVQNGVAAAPGKKSHKKSKRVKQRSGKGYD